MSFYNKELSSKQIRQIIGRKLKNRRMILGLTQPDIAKHLGLVHYSQVSCLENGKRPITIELLLTLSDILKVHPFYFLTGIVTTNLKSFTNLDELSAESEQRIVIKRVAPNDNNN